VVVNHGADQTFDFTPAPEHEVASVIVDGSPVAAAPSYTHQRDHQPHHRRAVPVHRGSRPPAFPRRWLLLHRGPTPPGISQLPLRIAGGVGRLLELVSTSAALTSAPCSADARDQAPTCAAGTCAMTRAAACQPGSTWPGSRSALEQDSAPCRCLVAIFARRNGATPQNRTGDTVIFSGASGSRPL